MVSPLNTFGGGTLPTQQLNPQILMATQLVNAVRRDVESLVPESMREGAVTVSETRIRQWQSALQNAVSLLNSVPAPLIFPPPAFVTLINQAVRQINQVLATLDTIAIASPAISPPQPGQASISLETLQFILADLRQAEAFLIQALFAS